METLPTVDELNLGLLLLRVVVGLVFAFHGFAKIIRGGRLAGTAGWFDSDGHAPRPRARPRSPRSASWPPAPASPSGCSRSSPAWASSA